MMFWAVLFYSFFLWGVEEQLKSLETNVFIPVSNLSFFSFLVFVLVKEYSVYIYVSGGDLSQPVELNLEFVNNIVALNRLI